MKPITIIISIVAFLLMSSSMKQLEYNRTFTLTIASQNNYSWTAWYKPDSAKVWKIENIWTGPGTNDFYIQVNAIETEHSGNPGYHPVPVPFWLGENDSIRFKSGNYIKRYALSIIEFNEVP